MNGSRWSKQVLQGITPGRSMIGRPRVRWMKGIYNEMEDKGLQGQQTKKRMTFGNLKTLTML
jgi:hypothetical protein